MKFDKKTLIIIAVVLITLLIAFIVVYNLGKKDDPSKVKAGNDEAGTTNLTQQELDYLNGLAINLHDDMEGLNVTGWETEYYEEASLLSDTKLVALSNIYNFKYESNSGETFLQWLQGEQFGFVYGDFGLKSTIQTMINRLVNLGVS